MMMPILFLILLSLTSFTACSSDSSSPAPTSPTPPAASIPTAPVPASPPSGPPTITITASGMSPLEITIARRPARHLRQQRRARARCGRRYRSGAPGLPGDTASWISHAGPARRHRCVHDGADVRVPRSHRARRSGVSGTHNHPVTLVLSERKRVEGRLVVFFLILLARRRPRLAHRTRLRSRPRINTLPPTPGSGASRGTRSLATTTSCASSRTSTNSSRRTG